MYEFNGCGQEYYEKWSAANVTHTMSQEAWENWYNDHCAKCPYMSEVCMGDTADKN